MVPTGLEGSEKARLSVEHWKGLHQSRPHAGNVKDTFQGERKTKGVADKRKRKDWGSDTQETDWKGEAEIVKIDLKGS